MDDSKTAQILKHAPESAAAPEGHAIEVTPFLFRLLNEAPLRLDPVLSLEFGVAPGLLMSQIRYWLGKSKLSHGGEKVARHSYSQWQRELPFSRQWIIELTRRLKGIDAIRVYKTKRVNLITLGKYQFKHKPQDYSPESKYDAFMLVFAALVREVGLTEAILLQQVHIRCLIHDDKFWVCKSYEQWRNDCMMFLSVRTIKRAVKTLVARKLLRVKKMQARGGATNGYRVDYGSVKLTMAGRTTVAPVIDWEKSPEAAKLANAEGGIWVGVGSTLDLPNLVYKKWKPSCNV